MGATPSTQSTQTIDTITATAINMSARSISTCTMQASQEQVARIDGVTIGSGNVNKIKQTQQIVMNMKCTQKAKVNMEILQAIDNAIKAEAIAKGTDMSVLSGSDTDITIKNRNELEADINIDNIVRSKSNSLQQQFAEIRDVTIGDVNVNIIEQDMTLEMFTEALADTIKASKFVQQAAADIDAYSKAETEGTLTKIVGSVTDMFGSYGLYIMLGIVALIVGVLVFGGVLFGGEEGTKRFASATQLASDKIGGAEEEYY